MTFTNFGCSKEINNLTQLAPREFDQFVQYGGQVKDSEVKWEYIAGN